MAGPTARTVRRLALASVVANAAIVVTGGAVRLTSSGLGCPTWPRCTATTYTPTAAYAAHGVIEFTNRLLTFALTAVVVATLVAVVRQRPRRPDLIRPATGLVLGIPAQAVLGGITVLTGLNPWTVMAHFLLSMVLLATAVLLHSRAGEHEPQSVPAPLRGLTLGVLAVVAVTLAVGTVVTGSGPHSGDVHAGRTGFNPASVSQLHADLVMLLVGLSVAVWVALAAAGAPVVAVRAARTLLIVEVAQAAIGWTQYFTHLPVALVGAHLAGACLVLVTACRLVLSAPSPRSAAGRTEDRARPSARPGAPDPAEDQTPGWYGKKRPEPASR